MGKLTQFIGYINGELSPLSEKHSLTHFTVDLTAKRVRKLLKPAKMQRAIRILDQAMKNRTAYALEVESQIEKLDDNDKVARIRLGNELQDHREAIKEYKSAIEKLSQ